jgi:hypothetical protein
MTSQEAKLVSSAPQHCFETVIGRPQTGLRAWLKRIECNFSSPCTGALTPDIEGLLNTEGIIRYLNRRTFGRRRFVAARDEIEFVRAQFFNMGNKFWAINCRPVAALR